MTEKQLSRVIDRWSSDSAPLSDAGRNDLAVAFWLRGASRGSLQDRLTALDLLMGLARKPRPLPEARFNLALVLSGLGLHETAQSWWRQVARDASEDPGWRREAELRVDASPEAPDWRDYLAWGDSIGAPELQQLLEVDAQGAFEGVLDHLISRYPGLNERQQRSVDRLARLSASRSEDGSGLRILESWHAAAAAGEETMDRYRAAFQSYEQGRTAYESGSFAAAEQAFEACVHLIAEPTHPLVLWSQSWRAGIDLMRADYPSLEARIQELVPRVADFRVLRGRLDWIRGVASLRQGRADQAIAHYRAAEATLAEAGQTRSVTVLNALLAESYRGLGHEQQAWFYNQRALNGFAISRPTPLLNNLLLQVAEAASDHGLSEAALALLEEGRALSRADPIASSEFSRWLAETLLSQNDSTAALDRVTASLQAAGRAGSPETVGYLTFMSSLTRARLLLHDRAEGASEALEAARSALGSGQRASNVRDLELLEVEIDLSLGRVAAAERALSKILELPDVPRAAFARDLREVLMLWLEYQTSAADDSMMTSALAFLEGVRAGRVVGEQEIQRALEQLVSPAANRYVVRFASSPERLFVWIFGSDGSAVVEQVDWQYLDLVEQVQSFESARARYPESWPTHSSTEILATRLLEAICRRVPEESSVAIVPAFELESLPFAALSCPGEERYLIERNELSLASGILAAVVPERARPRASALVVGDPAFDGELFSNLDRLPWSRREVQRLSDFYPLFVPLTGSEVTAEAVLARLGDRPFDVVHWSGHAISSKRYPGGYLLVSPGPDGGSSLLSLSDLVAPGIRDALVVLASCSPAPRQASQPGRRVRAADTSALEVAGSLIGGGADSVVLSLWEVDDKSTMELMTRLHAALQRTATAAGALREAQLEILRGSVKPTTAAWAAFVPVTG